MSPEEIKKFLIDLKMLFEQGLIGEQEYVDEKKELILQMKKLYSSNFHHGGDVYSTNIEQKQDTDVLSIGSILNGRYRLESLLGEGGMGRVFLAKDLRFGRLFAIKLISPRLELTSEVLSRFYREYELLENLSHPNIVRVFDVDQDENFKAAYIRMEYVEGQTLEDKILSSRKKNSKWSFFLEDKTKIWITQLFDALGFAHKKGIIHRDLKPSNLMISKDNSLKVMDFGIARLLENSDTQQYTSILGSKHYSAPELFLGDKVSPSTDIFSLGTIFLEMIEEKDKLLVENEICVPSFFSEEEKGLFSKMIARRQSERFQSTEECFEDLKRVVYKENEYFEKKSFNLKHKNPVQDWSPGKEPGEIRPIFGLDDAYVVWCPPGVYRNRHRHERGNFFDVESRISQGFWIMQMPITQRQFVLFMKFCPGGFLGGNGFLPLQTTLSDVQNLIDALSLLNGEEPIGDFTCLDKQSYLKIEGWRLPTDTELGYAAIADDYDKRKYIRRFLNNNSFNSFDLVGRADINLWNVCDILSRKDNEILYKEEVDLGIGEWTVLLQKNDLDFISTKVIKDKGYDVSFRLDFERTFDKDASSVNSSNSFYYSLIFKERKYSKIRLLHPCKY